MNHEISLSYYNWLNLSRKWDGPLGFRWQGRLGSTNLAKSALWICVQGIIDMKRREAEKR